jgi:small GTP-binding protein
MSSRATLRCLAKFAHHSRTKNHLVGALLHTTNEPSRVATAGYCSRVPSASRPPGFLANAMSSAERSLSKSAALTSPPKSKSAPITGAESGIRPDSKPSLSSRPGLLTLTQQEQIFSHRSALQDLLRAVERLDGVSTADVALLRAQLDRLSDGLFLLVVVGEYNAGKSSFINALLGQKLVAEGPVPTTAEVTIIRYGIDDSATQRRAVGSDGVAVIAQDIDLLRTISLVDSPGTNAIDRRHEALTKEYLPKCDLVLFVTSADRPFSESERLFLKSIRSWGKKCILIINKVDLLPDVSAKNEVVNFVKSSSRALLGSSPQIFPVSSRHAFEAKNSATKTSGPHWDASGFEALESFIDKRLDADERLRIKLESVASVGDAVGTKYIARLKAGRAVIAADQVAFQDVRNLVERCKSAVSVGFPAHFAQVDNVLLELLDRADLFFDCYGKPTGNWHYLVHVS